jgi:hypothetical protein
LVEFSEDTLATITDRNRRIEADNRDRRVSGLGQSREQVRGTTATGTFTDTGFSRNPSVGIGGERRCSFVPKKEVTDVTVVLRENVVESDARVSADSKEVLYVLCFETLY